MNSTEKAPAVQVEFANKAAAMVAANQSAYPPIRLLMRDEVLSIIGVSYSALWAWIRDGKFPPGREIGHGKKGHVAWVESEVLEWIASRPARLPKGSKGYQTVAVV